MSKQLFLLIIIITLNFQGFCQNHSLSEASWENIVNLSKENGKTVLIYVYSDSELCKDIERNVFNTETLAKLPNDVVFYKTHFESKETELFKVWGLTKAPTIFWVSYSKDIVHKVEPIVNEFDLEAMYGSIKDIFKLSLKRRDIFKRYHDKPDNPEAIKDYILEWKRIAPEAVLEKEFTRYLKLISEEEKVSDETIDLMLKCLYYADNKLIPIHLKQLERVTKDEKIYYQYALKERIISSGIGKISQGTIESKKYIKKSLVYAEQCNNISDNFTNISKEIFDIYYYSAARISNRLMKGAKAYYKKMAKIDKRELAVKDSIFYSNLEKQIANDSSLDETQKEVLRSKKNYFSNAYAANLNFIASSILFQQTYFNRINVGIDCAKKAVELAPNATRLAVYGLLCSKNEKYKSAYDSLLEAIELESTKKDQIEGGISQKAYSEFFKIQKRIPEN